MEATGIIRHLTTQQTRPKGYVACSRNTVIVSFTSYIGKESPDIWHTSLPLFKKRKVNKLRWRQIRNTSRIFPIDPRVQGFNDCLCCSKCVHFICNLRRFSVVTVFLWSRIFAAIGRKDLTRKWTGIYGMYEWAVESSSFAIPFCAVFLSVKRQLVRRAFPFAWGGRVRSRNEMPESTKYKFTRKLSRRTGEGRVFNSLSSWYKVLLYFKIRQLSERSSHLWTPTIPAPKRISVFISL